MLKNKQIHGIICRESTWVAVAHPLKKVSMNRYPFFKPASTVRGRLGQLCLFCASAALAVLFFSQTGLYHCPLRWGLGIECPGCGMTRAAACLLRLDFAGAWRMHPLVFAAAGFLLFAAWMWVTGQGNPLRKKWLLRTFAALFALWWGLRILRFLQGQQPDLLEPQALLPRVLRLLTGR